MGRFPNLAPGALLAATAVAGVLAAAPAAAQSRYVSPYIEATQAIAADLSNGDDVVTYTSLAAGIDAGVSTARTDAQISYRYERRFSWESNTEDLSVHSGLARATTQVAPWLSLDGGALATRQRSDIRGAAPVNLIGNTDNLTQVYSLFAGPSVQTRAGPFDVNGSYRFGYTKVGGDTNIALAPGSPRLDGYDSSTNHVVQASIGVPANRIAPVGVTVSGAYEREDANQLDQKYEGYYGRGDVVLPVSRTVALRAGAGYERIKATQRDPLVDAAGNAVVDRNGRFVTDPNSPERIAYDTDGLIYDAGVIWRPSPRVELQATAGYRYGGETYTGALSWRMSEASGLQVVVYDAIETFGRQLRDGIAGLPTGFQTQNDPFGQLFGGCIFGRQGGSQQNGAGGCLNDVFQSISTASYRARGIDGVWSVQQGRTGYGIGGGYANRRLYAPRVAVGTQVLGLEDQSAYAQVFYSRALSRVSQFDANLYANWFSSDLPGAQDVYGTGLNGTYSRNFGRLGTALSAGVYAFDQGDLDKQVSAQALLGARYNF
ncbi:hypothetical protein [Sphingomonas citricola]|uniref:hypothetical protein n=1 Tax=Sphingomonas citricola TaxID=2862498 RepID=UPI0027E49CCB|nr:hypothetical protein [Sphingomonas citricola]